MRYDSFPLDTQVENDLQSIYLQKTKNNLGANKQRAMLQLFCRHANSKSAPTRMTWQRCCSSNQTRCHLVLWIFIYIWIMNYSGRLAWHAYIHYLALPRCKVTWRQPIPLSSTMLLTFTSSTTRISSSAMENWATSGYCCFSLLFIFSFKNSRSFTWQIISQSINRCDSAVHIQSKKHNICNAHCACKKIGTQTFATQCLKVCGKFLCWFIRSLSTQLNAKFRHGGNVWTLFILQHLKMKLQIVLTFYKD